MIKAGVIGATGYAGSELIRLLSGHPEAEVSWIGSRSREGDPFHRLYGNMYQVEEISFSDDDLSKALDSCDVLFTATPQGYAASIVNGDLLKKVKLIDLSADFRIKDVSVYEKWYGIEHKAPGFLGEAVYGLCELARDRIGSACIIANPGCYTTCSILSCYPLVKEGIIDPDTLIIDAKSGTSGAGRGAKEANLFCEVNENMKAYGVATHRHTPEIEEQLSYAAGREITVSFTPHLVPMNRGILVTAYASLRKKSDGTVPDTRELLGIYEKYYGKERFIRILPEGVCPETRWVEGSNFTDIGVRADERTGRAVIMGALDNLVKGAAGQAVQNMNLLFGLPESTGLEAAPLFP